MLATKRSAGVAPEVNLGNLLDADNKHTIDGIHPSFKPREGVTRSPKQGYQLPHKRTNVLQKFVKKKLNVVKVSQGDIWGSSESEGARCCIIGQQTNVVVSNETNEDVRMYT